MAKKKKKATKKKRERLQVKPIELQSKKKSRKQRNKERLQRIREQENVSRERKKAMDAAMGVTSLGTYKKGMSFDEYASQLAPLVNLANERWEALEDQGLTSTAIEKAIEESGGRPYFSTDFAENIYDLIAEATRMRAFINDEASTIVGATLEMAAMSAERFRGKFGAQWGHMNMSPEINEELAREAFINYRKIAEASQALIKDGYGSENLIIALYDAEVRGLDSLMYGFDLLEKYYEKKKATWQGRFKEEAEEVENTVDKLWKEYKTHGARMGRL